jgi:hypothetical protein
MKRGDDMASGETNERAEITLTLKGYDEEQILTRLCGYLEDRMRDQVQGRLDKAIDAAVGGAMVRLVDEQVALKVAEACEAVITQGWQETNGYGEPTGKITTLKERIAGWLNARESGYSNSPTRIEKLMSEMIGRWLQKDFAKELDAAREAFKKQVDAVVTAKLGESLKAALGLR